MPINYREEYDRVMSLALLEEKSVTKDVLKKDEHIKKVNMYSNLANALALMAHDVPAEKKVTKKKSEPKVEVRKEESKEEKPATKEDLKPAPHVMGSEDSPEAAIPEEPKKEEADTTTITKEVSKVSSIVATLTDTQKHRNGYSIPMTNVMHWASQAIGTKIDNMNELNQHMDKLPQLTEYFDKLDLIFNKIGAKLEDAVQALTIGTQGRWTKLEDMSPDNIDIVVEVFKQYIAQQKQAQA